MVQATSGGDGFLAVSATPADQWVRLPAWGLAYYSTVLFLLLLWRNETWWWWWLVFCSRPNHRRWAGCQSVRQSVVFKMAGLVHQSLGGAAPAYIHLTLLMIVVFCRTLALVAHCSPMTCGSCLSRQQTVSSVEEHLPSPELRNYALEVDNFMRYINLLTYLRRPALSFQTTSQNLSLWRMTRSDSFKF